MRLHHPLTSTAPLLLLIIASSLSSYTLLSNDYFMRHIIDKTVERAPVDGNREMARRAREATERAMHNPVILTLISLNTGFVSGRSMLLFFLVSWSLFALMASRWQETHEGWRLFCQSSLILTVGVIINSILKFLFLNENLVLGPSLLFPIRDNTDPGYSIAKATDCFLLWFLLRYSSQLGKLCGDRLLVPMGVTACSWIIVQLGSMLAGIRFAVAF